MSSFDSIDFIQGDEGKNYDITRDLCEGNDEFAATSVCPTNFGVMNVHISSADINTNLEEDKLLGGETAVDLLIDEIDENQLNTPVKVYLYPPSVNRCK